jgi:hypothetical protein
MDNFSKSKIAKYITVFVGGIVTTFFIHKLRKYLKSKKKLSSSNKQSRSNELALLNNSSEQEILKEQLKRNYEFFGEEGMKKIQNSFVVVVGIGGVGR